MLLNAYAQPACSANIGAAPLQAQYNAPISDYGAIGVPANRVQVACEFLSDSSLAGNDLMAAMVRAVAAFSGNASIASGCLDITGAATGPEPEPEPYGPAGAPAGDVAGLVPEAQPEAEPEPASAGSPSKQSASAGDAVFQYTAGNKFAYQVRHAVSMLCLHCWQGYPWLESPVAVLNVPRFCRFVTRTRPPHHSMEVWHAPSDLRP